MPVSGLNWIILAIGVVAGSSFAQEIPSGAVSSGFLPSVAFSNELKLVTQEGHALLDWSSDPPLPSNAEFQLQIADNPSFEDARNWYRGRDAASFVSGLPGGFTYFRVRGVNSSGRAGPWSEPLTIEVAYHDRKLVVILLLTGTVVFFLTVGAILLGHRKHVNLET